ncbi:MAG: hypothetical protein IH985_07365 [Planctomycetes bacterium]|nr:hypothetical protein [Planctomycetota bacterium]
MSYTQDLLDGKLEPIDHEIRVLCDDTQSIHDSWVVYQGLLTPNVNTDVMERERIDIVFSVVRHCMGEWLIMTLARLTDVDKGGKNKVVTLDPVVRKVLSDEDADRFKDEWGGVWQKIKAQRDERVVHRDYKRHVEGHELEPLEPVTLGDIRRFLDTVSELMQRVIRVRGGGGFSFAGADCLDDYVQGMFHLIGLGARTGFLRSQVRAGMPIAVDDFMRDTHHPSSNSNPTN